jgi:hypothetical protein
LRDCRRECDLQAYPNVNILIEGKRSPAQRKQIIAGKEQSYSEVLSDLRRNGC